jgi:UDP-N-acetylmuramoyl-L-alanyl-D-glutamate--2,6-diaminopimelate ligase
MIAVAPIRLALEQAGLLASVQGVLPDQVSGVTDDSRLVSDRGLFVAVRGSVADGHDYIENAAGLGMALAVVEAAGAWRGPALVVTDSRRAVSLVGAAAHGFPARSLQVVGVTGTSGKTTTVAMLRHLLDAPQAPSASIGTLGVLMGSEGREFPGGQGLTTPGPIELHRVLRHLVDAGVRRVAMETSSHALDQHRVDGIAFAAAIFTNLTRDHLDYHGTMAAYLAAKAQLLALLAPDGAAVINADAPEWRGLPASRRTLRFGMAAANADVRAEGVAFGPSGSSWTLVHGATRAPVMLPLIGEFNVANALGAAAAAIALGMPVPDVARRLGTLPQIAGRLERIWEHPVVLRDYAHKPDALERALAAVRPFVRGRLIVVFGCGGDRDPGKRPIMGEIAARLADRVVLTSDNPRTEDPERILDQIAAGMPGGDYIRIEDRRAAIAHAMQNAAPGDVVLLAGKGHETYQIRGTTKHPFDEAAIVRDLAAGTRT